MKRRLDLDWDQVLGQNGDADEPPAILVVKSEPSPVIRPPPATAMSAGDRHQPPPPQQELQSMRDEEIEQAIQRQKVHIGDLASRLPDNGVKLRSHLKALEDELSRRRTLPPASTRTDIGGGCKPTKLMGSVAADGFGEETRPSISHAESEFASIFSRKMEDNARTDAREENAFCKEIAVLGHRDRQKKGPNESLPQMQRKQTRSSSKGWPFLSIPSISRSRDKPRMSDGYENIKSSSDHQFHLKKESHSTGPLGKKNSRQAIYPSGSRTKKAQTVVLLDEDEDEIPEKTTSPLEEVPESLKDAKIYYPSRDDPESVEICYMDTYCLAPEGYLTSPIMNFYIRYLQLHGAPVDNAVCDYHFFNTFFYNKLKQALAYKGSDKESFFAKFRRWWKGVDIFKKAYVLIPIHDDLHWSLVIVCIPDKEDESGPIILHLDSLRLHCSRSVFVNIRRYLIEEWKFINQDAAPVDVPIADRIWKSLSRRIEEKIISVPQQRNDYDCGLFVLFFMERFMEEAPERLRKRDLSMFGKQWFRPEQASGLRAKIQGLLLSEFKKSQTCAMESACSADGLPP